MDAVRGFSLIEVVLAVGVVAFAIIAIIALFGSSLESSRQVTDEDEALGIVRALPAFLQQQGFNTVYGWIVASSTTPTGAATLYGYNIVPTPLNATTAVADSAQMAVIYSSTNPSLTSGATAYQTRAGRLFAIQLSMSPNMAIHSGTAPNASIITQPTASQLPSSSASYGESILPVHASLYSIGAVLSGTNSIPAGAPPVFSYDTAVSR